MEEVQYMETLGWWKYGNVSMEGIYNRNVRIYGIYRNVIDHGNIKMLRWREYRNVRMVRMERI